MRCFVRALSSVLLCTPGVSTEGLFSSEEEIQAIARRGVAIGNKAGVVIGLRL